MPKERSKRFTLHNSSVKVSRSKGQLQEKEAVGSLVVQSTEAAQESVTSLKKKDRQQQKREAFLQKLELTQSPYSRSHQRRLNRKAREQIGQGLDEIRDVLQSVDDGKAQTTIAQDAAKAEDKLQMKVDGDEDTLKSVQQSKVKSSQIGEGRASTLSDYQRKKALKIERLRHPFILSNPQFASNPFETIRTHAQNTLVKHVPTRNT
ncbi:ribosome biogenesis protein SLX9-domain-containing protein [Lentinula detonsa]|uniref:Ribosome biogenesis protein SLX9 n=1 Tax=Lentinula detonsa TaxID=2804962 RepID=A0A9W8U2F0_9AGAR|nr:ribosome biogenesis protein SLX9-domain-containing protein [Lentinula detonsa]